MRDLRIVFMGTPDFAVTTLTALVKAGHLVVGVVTAPDRPAGRGRKLRTSAVKDFAVTQGLTVLQPTNLRDKEFLGELRSLGANLQVVVAFRMLPRVVWAMPEYGTFNLHASLLPDYRGAAPINWAIMNGETRTGATTFFIDDKIDTGEIILQRETHIADDDTAGSLHDRLMHLGAALVLDTLRLIADNAATPRKQSEAKMAKTAHKLFPETCKIDWHDSLDRIHDHVRGLCPYPVAWTNMVNGEQRLFLKIFKTAKEEEEHHLPIGQVVVGKREMKVAAKGGYVHLLEIQLPGKRRMSVGDVLNGLTLEKSAHMV